MTYEGYTNDYVFNHAFDVSNDGNMLAVADQSRTVKLYNVWSGTQLESPLTKHKFDIIPRVAKWSDAVLDRTSMREIDDGSESTQGILVSNGARLDYWSWATRDCI